MKTHEIGVKGEKLAAQFLQSKGYKIVANHVTMRGGEIDLIVMKDQTLVFVEVKTRSGVSFGHGHESVDRTKRIRLLRAIEGYLLQHARSEDPDYRFDIIEVAMTRDTSAAANIQHFEDVEL